MGAASSELKPTPVPPEGAQVVRRWQSARAIDGSLRFWIGRSKTPRRTDIAPAIRFDVVKWTQRQTGRFILRASGGQYGLAVKPGP